MDILNVIKPITLLKGSHADTGTTGQGCFMNVIAYLNGEPQITDQSPCVCPVVRPIAIWLNDYMRANERQQLLPFIMRAMGSATTDKGELVRRAWLAVDFANEMKKVSAYAYANAHAAHAAAAGAAIHAVHAVHAAAARAAIHAANAARAAHTATHGADYVVDGRKKIIAAAIKFLDNALPPLAQMSPVCGEVMQRAERLVELNK